VEPTPEPEPTVTVSILVPARDAVASSAVTFLWTSEPPQYTLSSALWINERKIADGAPYGQAWTVTVPLEDFPAADRDGYVRWSAQTTTPFGTVKSIERLLRVEKPPVVPRPNPPRLTFSDLKATSVVLSGAAADVPGDVDRYELRRGSTMVRSSKSISDFATVIETLTENTAYQYALVAIGPGGESTPAVVTFRSPFAPAAIIPNWFGTGPSSTDGASGPVSGDVYVRYSSDVRTTDGHQLTSTQQLVKAVDGYFRDPATAELWRGYRSPNPDDYIEWIERFIGPDGRASTRSRRFRFPAQAAGPDVEYLDRMWFDDAPAGTSLPVWAQELDAKVARVEAAAQVVTAAVEAMSFVLVQDTDGVFYPKPIGD
jgi:hypothetical protein